MEPPAYAAFHAIAAAAVDRQRQPSPRFYRNVARDDAHHELLFWCPDVPHPLRFGDGRTFWSLSLVVGRVDAAAAADVLHVLNTVHTRNVLDRWTLAKSNNLIWSMWAPYARGQPPTLDDIEMVAAIAFLAAGELLERMADAGIRVAVET